MKIEISLFKFDKNSDYLPYYTKHFIKVENQKNLLDILNTINQNNPLGYEKNKNFDLVVNGLYLKTSISITELVKNFGKDLIIEPISIRRSYNDLLIDTQDFEDRIEILSEFVDDEDKEYYQTLKQYFYASNTLNYESDYIGDSILILANNLINKKPKLKNMILKELKKVEIGAQYHTNLENRIFDFDKRVEEQIETLQNDLGYRQSIDKQNFRINNTLKLDFGEFEKEYDLKHNFSDFNIAYYKSETSNETNSLLDKLDSKILNLDTLKLDLAKETFNSNPKITHYVASTILLDAFDNNADFVVVDNNEDFYIFDYNRKELEKVCGREVLIPIIHKNELQKLVNGKHKEAKITLDKHCINPEII